MSERESWRKERDSQGQALGTGKKADIPSAGGERGRTEAGKRKASQLLSEVQRTGERGFLKINGTVEKAGPS